MRGPHHAGTVDLRLLRYFAALAEELDIERAATTLHLKPASLARDLGRLEQECGQLLVHRGRYVELTPSGREFARRAVRLLAATQAASYQEEAACLRTTAGCLAVGLATHAGTNSFATLLRAYRASEPLVELTVHRKPPDRVMELVCEGQLDLGYLPLGPRNYGLGLCPLENDRLVAILPASHRLADRSELSFEAVAGEPWVGVVAPYDPVVEDRLVQAAEEAGLTPRILSIHARTMKAGARAVQGTGAIGFCLASRARAPLRGTVFRPLAEPAPVVDLGLVWRNENSSPNVDSFQEVASLFQKLRRPAWQAQLAN
jgi:DNA-binding transcriptional LysR family regulator